MKLRAVAALGLTAALALTACGGDSTGTPSTTESAPAATTSASESESTSDAAALSGEVAGMGASSMKVAQGAWTAKFMEDNSGVRISYAPEGSGAGREGIQQGKVAFAGSDEAFSIEDNKAGSFAACSADSGVLDLPVYISPVAIIFNLPGVESLNMTGELAAKIFKGDVAKWNDAAIAELNPGVTLPDEYIVVVYRGDKSGTTENFTDYLHAVAPSVWDNEADKEWPYTDGGQPAQQTDGVKSSVASGPYTIGYVDASAADGVGVAHLGKDGKFFAPDPEQAAAVVDNSELESGRAEGDLAVKLNREAEGYPIVLISYAIACAKYDDANTAELVKAYLTYISSAEGQALAAEQAGSAPLSDEMMGKVKAAIDSINA